MVMSVATGVDGDVMGGFDGRNLECGWRRLYRRMATTKIQKSDQEEKGKIHEIQHSEMPTSENNGGGGGRQCTGNDYVISWSR